MKGRRSFLYAFLLLFAIFIAFVSWSLYTESGTALFFKGIQGALPGTFEARSVTGRMGRVLHMEGVSLRLTGLTVTVNSADVKWHPLYMLAGKLAITHLHAAGISISSSRSAEEKPVDLGLPQLPGWFALFEAWIKELTVDGLSYRTEGSEAVTVKRISTVVLIDRGSLFIYALDLDSVYGRLQGNAMVNLVRPALQAKFTAALGEKVAGMDTIFVDAHLSGAGGKQQIAGPLVLRAASGNKERFSLRCRVGVARQAVVITDAKLVQTGGRGTIDARASMDLSGANPAFTLAAHLTQLDLSGQVPVGTDLSGDLAIAGSTDLFRGTFTLKNRGEYWRAMDLTGKIRGDSEAISLEDFKAGILGGAVTGTAMISRGEDMVLSAALSAKGLDPARISRGLEGNLNFSLEGKMLIPRDRPLEGRVNAVFRNSRFQGKMLSANLDTAFGDGTVKVNTLVLKGDGFGLNASGALKERLSWEARVDDASKLLAGTRGSLFAGGWARWSDGEASGVLRARGTKISYDTTRVGSLNAVIRIPDGLKGEITADIAGRGISHDGLRADTLDLTVKGTMEGHRIVLGAAHARDRVDLLAEGRYTDRTWQGTILKLTGSQAPFGTWGLTAPAAVHASPKKVSLSRFELSGEGNERMELATDMTLKPMIGFASARWEGINLARVNRFLGQPQLEGSSSGSSRIEWLRGNRISLSGNVDASGGFSQGSIKVQGARVGCRVKWDRTGLLGSLDVDLGARRGRADTRISSKEPASLSIPKQAVFESTWNSIDMSMLQPVLGETLFLKGLMSGQTKGRFLPEKRFELSGETAVTGGSLAWRGTGGEISVPIRKASLSFAWKGTSLTGNVDIALEQYGYVRAAFDMPMAARLPPAMDGGSPLMISTRGSVGEKGLLAALFPGVAQETSANIDFNLAVGGTVSSPTVKGRLDLKGASAYLPSAGIRVTDTSANVVFENDRATLSCLVHSKPGQVKINGTARHARGRITSFEGTLKGEQFQAIDLPELRASVNPDITFMGNTENVTVRGSVLVPDLVVQEEQKETLIKPSPDVVIEGRPKEEKKALPFAIDVLVSITLGDKVFVKAYGIDTRLKGSVTIAMKDPGDVRARGVISTVGGKFDAYGVKLDVRRGNISFGGGPVDRANLDILALRKVEDVSAGVLVAGTPASPLVSLYSEPPLADKDILSYIVLGRAGGASGQDETALLARAATGLLAGRKASTIQKQLGLDVLDVKSTEGDVSKSIVTLGKYLSPGLFISYGRSIYTGENIFGLRYSLTRHVDIESTMGNQSGAAIYYRIEFR